jgi:hypothetical protein
MITPLKYADDDAIAVRRMLMSKGVGLDSTQIHFHINKDATVANILCSYSWLEAVTKKGDRVYLFFSGHGDAVDPELVYLLPYDADISDPNNYEITALGVDRIKGLIRKLSAKGVQSFIFLDACRSNELFGKDNLGYYVNDGILQKNYGEVQLTSCSKNELSFEDYRWGNGHGVFSYYLIKGWLGFADVDSDKVVTVFELQSYVKSEVHRDTRSYSDQVTKQKPTFCCTEKEDIILSKVDSVILNKLKQADKEHVVVNDIFAYATSKSTNFKNSLTRSNQIVLDSIVACINDGRILNPKLNSARTFYINLRKNLGNDTLSLNLTKIQILSILLENGQKTIDLYLNQNPEDYSSYVIKNAMDQSEFALSLVDPKGTLYNFVKAKYLFFKSQFYYSQKKYPSALLTIDTAISLSPNAAYLHFNRGLIHKSLNKVDSCLADFNRSIDLASNWSSPYQTKSLTLIQLGKNDEANKAIDQMIAINGKSNNYRLAGDFYFSIDNFVKAKSYYITSYKLDHKNEKAAVGLAITEKLCGTSSSYSTSVSSDSSYFLKKNASYFEKVFEYDKAALTYLELYKIDTTNLANYLKYAECLIYNGESDKSLKIYREVIKTDKFCSEGVEELATYFEKHGQYDSALYYRRKLYKLDKTYNPVKLYTDFKELGLYDSAIVYLNLAMKNPTFSTGLNLCETANIEATELYRKKDSKNALKVIETIYTAGLENCETHTVASAIYDQLNMGNKAIEHAYKAIECDPTNDINYTNLSLYYKRYTNKMDSSHYFVIAPYTKFKCTTKPYLTTAAFYLTFMTYPKTLYSIAALGTQLYPKNFEFDLYLSIYYYDVQNMSLFYQYFEKAINKGLDQKMYYPHSYRWEGFIDDDLTFQALKAKIKK